MEQLLTGLRKKEEFKAFRKQVRKEQKKEDKQKKKEQQEKFQKDQRKKHIANIIKSLLNASNKETFDVNRKDLVVNVSILDKESIDELVAALCKQGYECKAEGAKLTIDLTPDSDELKEDPKPEEPVKEEPKPEEPKPVEQAPVEEVKPEEPKVKELKVEEPKVEEKKV